MLRKPKRLGYTRGQVLTFLLGVFLVWLLVSGTLDVTIEVPW